jgi:adenylosuccinate lyase
VQRNAMRAWNGKGSFDELLRGDADVAALLSEAEIDELFDVAYHTRHVDTIFRRVFGIDAQDHR